MRERHGEAELRFEAGDGGVRPEDEGYYRCVADGVNFGFASVQIFLKVIGKSTDTIHQALECQFLSCIYPIEPNGTGSVAFVRFSLENFTTIEAITNDSNITEAVARLELAQVVSVHCYLSKIYTHLQHTCK